MKWSPCGQQLASGGNDNMLCIWDVNFRLVHKINAHQVSTDQRNVLTVSSTQLIWIVWCSCMDQPLAAAGSSQGHCMVSLPE
jgi:WD40 repeat protein